MSDIINGEYEQQVAIFSITDAVLATIKNKYDIVPDATTKEGYEMVKTSLSDLVKYRTSLESERKAKKQPHIDAGKTIDSEAKRIQSVLTPMETVFKNAKESEDKKVELAKQKRLADLQKKINSITENLHQARGKDSEGIKEHIKAVEEIDALEGFYDLTDQAIQTRIDTLTDLKIMLNDAIVREDFKRQQYEFARQKAEFEASQPVKEIDTSSPIQIAPKPITSEKRFEQSLSEWKQNFTISDEAFDALLRLIK